MMRKTENHIKKSAGMLPGAKKTFAAVSPSFDSDDATAAFKTYSPIVDTSEFDGAVCGGDLTGQPKIDLSVSECAMACDEEAPKSSSEYCVGFQYFDGSQYSEDSLCFLFKKVKSLATYKNAGSFLQTKKSGAPVCLLRHTDFGPAERNVVEAATGVLKGFGADAPSR